MQNPQKQSDWKQDRRGKITASRFGDVLAKPTTKRYQSYLQEIVWELKGVPDFESEDKPWFQHGKDWEDEARGRYEWETNSSVVVPGFILHPKHEFIGCSGDGLIGEDGGLEIKSRKSIKSHLKSVKAGLPSEHRPQVQGCMWVTGRMWWDFESYYKPMKGDPQIHIHRVEADKKYHDRLEQACLNFWKDIQEKV